MVHLSGPEISFTDSPNSGENDIVQQERISRAGVSAREAEVLAGIAEHLTNAEIAARLFISVRTDLSRTGRGGAGHRAGRRPAARAWP
jgi:FixJ family two-component response regulator